MGSDFDNELLIKTKYEEILRFSYDDTYGIYYEDINKKGRKKNIVCNKSFKYFYVTEDMNRNINIICQDLFGNIILCVFINGSWKYKALFYMKYNFITSIKIKGFFLERDLKLIYYLDSDSKNLYFNDGRNKYSTKIYSENDVVDINFNIIQDKDKIFVIINSTSLGIYKLILKEFNIKYNRFMGNRIIYISNNQYVDYSYLIKRNKIHFLLVTIEDEKKYVVYKNINLFKDDKIQKDVILFENKKVSSCLLVELNKAIWAFWISENKFYGSYSLNLGEDFTDPIIYMDLRELIIRKIKLVEGNINKEIYIIENNGQIELFLDKIFSDNDSLDINYKEIQYSETEINEFNIENEKITKLNIDNKKKLRKYKNNIIGKAFN